MVAEDSTDVGVVESLGERLDRRGGLSLYRQIKRLVIDQVDAGRLKVGDRVPSQRALSQAWGVSEMTVRRAMGELASAGYVYRHVGRGTTILVPVSGVGSKSAKSQAALGRGVSGVSGGVGEVGILFRGLTDGYPFFRPLIEGLGGGPGGQGGLGGPVIRLQDLPGDGVGSEDVDLNGMNGVVMCSPISVGVVHRCQQLGLAYVLVYSDVDDGVSRCVVVDYLPGVMGAVQHLVERGKRRIALVTAADERFSTGQLSDAFRVGMQGCGLSMREDFVIHAGYEEADGYRATRALLGGVGGVGGVGGGDGNGRPDAIVYASDYQARGGLIAAHEMQIETPKDLAVVGCGCLLREKEWLVPVTSVDLCFERVGGAAMSILRGLCSGEVGVHTLPRRTVVRSELRVGGTS